MREPKNTSERTIPNAKTSCFSENCKESSLLVDCLKNLMNTSGAT